MKIMFNVFLLSVVIDAFDNPLMIKTMKEIVAGQQANIPIYDFKTHSRLSEYYLVSLTFTTYHCLLVRCRSKIDHKVVYTADVILFEGILVLYSPELRELMQMKIFVDTDSDTRLARRSMLFFLHN